MENLIPIFIIGAILGLVVELRGMLVTLIEKVETIKIELQDKKHLE